MIIIVIDANNNSSDNLISLFDFAGESMHCHPPASSTVWSL
jgi:hypothetical protein